MSSPAATAAAPNRLSVDSGRAQGSRDANASATACFNRFQHKRDEPEFDDLTTEDFAGPQSIQLLFYDWAVDLVEHPPFYQDNKLPYLINNLTNLIFSFFGNTGSEMPAKLKKKRPSAFHQFIVTFFLLTVFRKYKDVTGAFEDPPSRSSRDSGFLSFHIPVAAFYPDTGKEHGGSTLLPAVLQHLPVVVEVGVNRSPTTPPPNTTILSFEPLLGRYADVLTMNKNDNKKKHNFLSYRPSANGIILPVGVLDKDGYAELHVSQYDACSSFSRSASFSENIQEVIPSKCTHVAESRIIPVVTLTTIVKQYLNGRTIEFLYLDGEGRDIQIMSGGKDVFDRIPRVLLEIHMMKRSNVSVGDEGLFEGELPCQEVVQKMEAWGYELGEISEKAKQYLGSKRLSQYLSENEYNGAHLLHKGGEWSCTNRPVGAHTFDAYFVRRDALKNRA